MKGRIHTTTVEGKKYNYWADFSMRCEYAENENGEVKKIYGGGYISNDLAVRKAIANAFGHNSFRK